MRSIMLCLNAVVVSSLWSALALAGEWQLIDDHDGIRVYAKEESDDLVSFKGEATFAVKPAAIFDVMKDNSVGKDWIPMVVSKRDVKAIDDSSRIEYTHIKMPWPLTDRYFVNHATIKYLPGGVFHIAVKSVEETDIVEADKVRGLVKHSAFVMTPVDGGARTHMLIEMSTDPKGSIPKWMVNLGQKNWPRQFFEGLQEQLSKRGHLSSPVLVH